MRHSISSIMTYPGHAQLTLFFYLQQVPRLYKLKFIPHTSTCLIFLFPLFFITIIRELDNSGNLVKPLTRDERIASWNYFQRNSRCHDRIIDYRLMELVMFCNYNSSLKSDSDSGCDSDSSFCYVFPRNRKIMATFDLRLRT